MALKNCAFFGRRNHGPKQAEPLLSDSPEILRANHAEQNGVTTATIQALTNLCDQWGQPDQAAEWRAKLPTTQPVESSSNP